ncbi:RRM domain-containing protein [Citrus sinensis]|uniref:RRM domain-containing protein n=2 Tax=Citrus sinensis TaxID=2711 RepID=A0ACB8JVK7_CITSI|nr:RRM domain-containing protein [Citrus sinensis]
MKLNVLCLILEALLVLAISRNLHSPVRVSSRMTSALDMSLDDIIKSNKRSSSRGRGGGGRGSGLGPARHTFKRGVNRTAPYSKPVQAPQATWPQNMIFNGAVAAAAARSSSIESGTKLYISNLEYGVSNEDIKELFSEVGELKRCSVHFDRSGRSKGTAEVVLTRRADAIAAVKRYNNVQLDGKPMKIEIIGTNIGPPAAVLPITNVMYGNEIGMTRSRLRMGGAIPIERPRRGRGGLGGRGGRGGARGGRGRGRGQGAKPNLSVEDLDADLEKYHIEAKQSDGMVH